MRGFIIGTVVTAVAFYILVTLLPDMFAYSGGIPSLIVISINVKALRTYMNKRAAADTA